MFILVKEVSVAIKVLTIKQYLIIATKTSVLYGKGLTQHTFPGVLL
jgi:hypothetical protein